MSDTISRSQAIVEMMDEDVDYVQGTSGREVIQILMDLPDKQPPQGRWALNAVDWGWTSGVISVDGFICSECNKKTDREYPYCPYCGAKMEAAVI
jgi:hypothetical protein